MAPASAPLSPSPPSSRCLVASARRFGRFGTCTGRVATGPSSRAFESDCVSGASCPNQLARILPKAALFTRHTKQAIAFQSLAPRGRKLRRTPRQPTAWDTSSGLDGLTMIGRNTFSVPNIEARLCRRSCKRTPSSALSSLPGKRGQRAHGQPASSVPAPPRRPALRGGLQRGAAAQEGHQPRAGTADLNVSHLAAEVLAPAPRL